MGNRYSSFANRFLRPSGTKQLMDDLSEVANSESQIINLGGGNPGVVDHAHSVFTHRIKQMLADNSIDNILRRYDGPQGHLHFRQSLAQQLSNRFGWRIGAERTSP